MIERGSHISMFFIVLISLSMSLSTVHFHQSIEKQVTPEAQTHTTIGPDATFCPVCGYLFNAQTDGFIQSTAHISVITTVVDYESADYFEPHLVRKNNRSPPILA